MWGLKEMVRVFGKLIFEKFEVNFGNLEVDEEIKVIDEKKVEEEKKEKCYLKIILLGN